MRPLLLLQVGEKMLTRYPLKTEPDGLQTASIGLLYPLSHRNGLRLAAAKNDKLQLKCTAKIGSIYWESVVVETILKRDGYMLESRSSGASGTYIFVFTLHDTWKRSQSRWWDTILPPSKSLDTLYREQNCFLFFSGIVCLFLFPLEKKALESSSVVWIFR